MLKSIFSVIIRYRSHDETTQHIYIFLNKLLTVWEKKNVSGWEVKKKVK